MSHFPTTQEDAFEMICYTLFLFLPVWEMTGHGVWIESCMTAEGQLLIDRSSPIHDFSPKTADLQAYKGRGDFSVL